MRRFEAYRGVAFAAGLAVTAAGCAAGGMGSSGGPFEWPAGTSFDYVISESQGMSMEIPTVGAMSMNTVSTMELTVSATGTPREFRIHFTDASMTVDSDMGTGDEMPDISALRGAVFTVRLGDRGDVVEADGLEENASIQELGGPEQFKQTLGSLFLYMPEGELEAGSRWTRDYTYPSFQSGMSMSNTASDSYVCEEMTDYEGTPAMKVNMTSSISFAGGGEQMGQAMDMSASGSMIGSLYADPMTGAVVFAEARGTIMGGISAGGMDIPINMSLTATIRRK